ncbi:MAG TPA: transcription antitermination factor NusB [Bryobacteraceae bacterium]|nr:transcription antitermination factor NusB [Bryobacteraceae bacterium]
MGCLVSPARQVAFDVLRQVHTGGYAADLLVKGSAGLDSRDAGLASEIVFGCLRYQAQLDYLIGRLAPGRLDPEVRIALRMGVYQLRYLDRVPAHAALSESVELVKRARKRSAAGLVNAVLRKIDRQPAVWPDRATELSMPGWLLDKWDRQFGREMASQIAAAFLKPAETYLAGTGRIQDIGAQSIVPMLNLHPGLTFLDLCAAPGNKTAQALAAGAETVACDIHWHRLKQLGDLRCRRVVLDGTRPLPFRSLFDRILVDAPCSGTGTLGRNPEIKWRLKPSDLAELHDKQVALLRNGVAWLRPGGRLVYSTCSLEEEENQQVIDAVPGPWQVTWRLPGREAGDGFFIAVLTSV